MSWKAPSERVRDLFSALAKIASSGLMRQFIRHLPFYKDWPDFSGFGAAAAIYYLF
jgi:hypothetical protein